VGGALIAAPPGRRVRWGWAALCIALCVLPHAARWFGPNVVAVDGFYGHAALMIARGFQPYLDFTQVAFPLAESVLALAVRLFGHDLRVVELVGRLVVAGVAIALYVAGRRLAGRRAGAVAALCWCWSLWVVHFNLFERETWAALGVSLGLAAYLGAERLDARRALAVAAALALGFLVKVTAVLALVGLAVHMALGARWRELGRVAGWFLGIVSMATLVGWLVWGAPFLWQVYLFGFFRNAPEPQALASLGRLLRWMDPATALGLAAWLAIGWRGLRRAEGAPALVLAGQLTFELGADPVLWEHNLIEFAPASALLVGAFIAGWPRGRLGFGGALIGLVVAVPLAGGGWLAGDYGPLGPGLGGWPREALDRRAALLQRYTRPDEIVCTTNPWWSFHAGRVEAVRYWDLQPVAQGLQASLRADGLSATFAKRQGPLLLGAGRPDPDPRALLLDPYLGRELACSLAWTRPRLLAALARREVALVVEPLPPLVLTAADLRAAGYGRFEDHELGQSAWRPPGGASYPRVRPLYGR
jgi:hypothetical protein